MSPSVESLTAHSTLIDIATLRLRGVYILIRDNEVVYVGQSRNTYARIGTHARTFHFDRALYIPEQRRDRRLALEGALLRRFNPVENIAGPKLGGHRDAAILARIGLTPDPDSAAAFIARQNARWTKDARARIGQCISNGYASRRHRLANAKRRARNSRALWLAVLPFVSVHETNLSGSTNDRSDSAHADQKSTQSQTGTEA